MSFDNGSRKSMFCRTTVEQWSKDCRRVYIKKCILVSLLFFALDIRIYNIIYTFLCEVAFKILEKKLNQLTDMKFVYSKASTLQKRGFVKIVFDSNIYYENGIYRTPTMIDLFSINHFKIKE